MRGGGEIIRREPDVFGGGGTITQGDIFIVYGKCKATSGISHHAARYQDRKQEENI